jgi:hypothetical protein
LKIVKDGAEFRIITRSGCTGVVLDRGAEMIS